jgi:methylated-DNA-[protein]-cysteine S-methyltransferase
MRKKIDWNKYTPFQQKVLKFISKIPAGHVMTYSQVAAKLGNKKLARAVGNALGSNLDAPIIPCHRVVAAHSLGGYSAPGGLKKKIKLLKQEGWRG